MQQLKKKGMVKGLSNIHFFEGDCKGCVLGKHLQEKNEKGKAWGASFPLDIFQSDLMGPVPHPSMSRAIYELNFIDDYSRHTWVYFLKKKYEVFEYLKYFKTHAENKYGNMIKILNIDNGGECVNKDSKQLCDGETNRLQHTIPYIP